MQRLKYSNDLRTLRMTIHRGSLHDDVTLLMRKMIFDGELQAGEKIVEQALCERFGVSRTPLREALKVLAAEGLVDLLPRRGAVVTKITAAEIEELFPVMGALEALAGKLALSRITEYDIERLTRLHDKMMASFVRRDEKNYIRVNHEIHETIFEIAKNTTLTSLYHQVLSKTHMVRFVVRKTREQWESAVRDHEKIIDAIKRGDADALGGILYVHMVETAADIARTSLATASG
jgi:DNA-binding GntR family transcriptional regulator